MRKLKYGLLLILTMILFPVPVLAAKTYYLPSKVVSQGETYLYSYDKYGHLIDFSPSGKYVEDEKTTWKYKYDRNGKRISGEEYIEGKLCYKLTFDKNDRLKINVWSEWKMWI